MKKECLKLFHQANDLSDDYEFMKEFIKLVKEFTDWNCGDVALAIFNLKPFNFGDTFVIAYNDMGGGMEDGFYRGFEFINIITNTYKEYDDEEYLENFWIPRLNKLIKKY